MIEATLRQRHRQARPLHPTNRSLLLYAFLVQLAACLVLASAARGQQPGVRLDVPYVPTPQSLVNRMLQIADVKQDEMVLDLGCGDGRMVVTAAKHFGARGLGVDIDPVRINEAKGNAQRAGVTERVEFRNGDLFDVDLSEADVLAIYLLNEINLRLRPKILSTMKPGARVVSHAFHMGDWQPDLHERVDGRNVYYWVVPARAAGRWQIRQGDEVIDLELQQTYQRFAGNAMVDGRAVPIREGRLDGALITFVIEPSPGQARTYRGRVDGDRIEAADGSDSPWQATRRSI